MKRLSQRSITHMLGLLNAELTTRKTYRKDMNKKFPNKFDQIDKAFREHELGFLLPINAYAVHNANEFR